MKKLLVVDVETQKDFHEVGGRGHFDKLGISVAGVYDYVDDKYICFTEDELPDLERLIEERDGVVGYNIVHFDFPVLQPYFSKVSLEDVYTVDLMKHVEQALGFRLPLASISQATLGKTKSGMGRDAVPLYKAGKIDELKKYCLDDVRLTKELYEHGSRTGSVSFVDRAGKTQSISANWAHVVERDGALRTMLSEALEKQRVVHLVYAGTTDEETTERDIEVQAIRGTAIEAFCHLRNGRRRFKLDRIISAEVQEKANTQQTLF